jgi:hypothetical protein
MAVYRDGVPVPRTIFEAAALHYSVKVHCSRCTNTAVFEPAGVWWRFHRKGWSDHFANARSHFWCTRCAIGGLARVRPSFLEAVKDRPIKFLEPPPDREWKRATHRFRT